MIEKTLTIGYAEYTELQRKLVTQQGIINAYNGGNVIVLDNRECSDVFGIRAPKVTLGTGRLKEEIDRLNEALDKIEEAQKKAKSYVKPPAREPLWKSLFKAVVVFFGCVSLMFWETILGWLNIF